MCDITICALCKHQLQAARLLPCLHSFCLKCLDDIAQDRLPGDKLTCPTCEDTFRIPDEGLSALPANSFVDNLLRLRKDVCREDLSCDVCASEVEESRSVTSFCLDCRQNMCAECRSYHVKFSGTKEHRVVSRGADDSAPVQLEDTDWCIKHGNRREELYCEDCGSSICLKCYTDKHNTHTCSDISAVADEFREQIRQNIEEMEQLTIENQSEERDLCRARDDILDQLTETEFTVLRMREELISCIERDTNELMNDLQYFSEIVTSEYTVSSDKLRKRSNNIDSFRQFAREVLNKGSASTVANVVSCVKQRALEIQTQCHKSRNRKRPVVDVNFQPLGLSSLSRAKNKRKVNLVGRVTTTIIQRPEVVPPRSEVGNILATSILQRPEVVPPQPEVGNMLVTWFSATSLRENPEPTIKKLIPKHTSQEPEAMARRARKVPQIKQSEVAISRTAVPSRWQRQQSDKSASPLSSSDEEVIPNSEDDDDAVTRPDAEASKDTENSSNKESETGDNSPLETVQDVDTSSTSVIFSHKAKLYRFSNGSWRIRGIGDMEVLRMQHTNTVYLMMKNKQVWYSIFQ